MPLHELDETERLVKISENHSYGDGFNGRLTKYRALKIKELIGKCGSLLDMGCGEGFLTRALADHFSKIVVTEGSPSYLKKAREVLSGFPVEYHNTLLEDFHTNEKFDAIVASGILEHVKEPEVIIHKAKKMLKPTGVFIAIVPNACSLHRQVGRHMGLMRTCYDLGEQDHKVGHRRYYDLNRLKEEIQSADLKISDAGGILLKPLPNVEMERLNEAYCDALYQVGNSYPELCAEVYVACTPSKA